MPKTSRPSGVCCGRQLVLVFGRAPSPLFCPRIHSLFESLQQSDPPWREYSEFCGTFPALRIAEVGSSTMPREPDDLLKSRLARYRQIKLTVIGRKSGRTISIPVCYHRD